MTGHQYPHALDAADQNTVTVLAHKTTAKDDGPHRTADVRPAQSVPIDQLTVGEGPRLAGEDIAHIRRLTEVVDELPPIVVHRGTMRVIDGVHRLRAAHLVGRDTVEVAFFDGTEDSAFVRAVEANVRHGLPLSVAERRAAATRIMTSYIDWSDRRIATVAGLSPRTVAEIRSASCAFGQSGDIRLGRDGRARPIDAASGRKLAGRLLAERPEASLREIARAAGISPETVRDVRDRRARGEDPVPPGRRGKQGDRPRREAVKERSVERVSNDAVPRDRKAAIVQALRRDPSLRLTESGRLLLRWLDVSQAAARDWHHIVRAIPSHRVQQIAALAKSCAEEWGEMADQMNSRSATQPSA